MYSSRDDEVNALEATTLILALNPEIATNIDALSAIDRMKKMRDVGNSQMCVEQECFPPTLAH